LVIDAPESAVAGDEINYVLRYYNESSTDLTNGTLSLTLPAGLSLVDEGAGTASGQTVEWSGLDVPAGSSSDGGGGKQSVIVEVGADVASGTKLVTDATFSDGAAISVNDKDTLSVSSEAILAVTIDAARYVVPGEVVEYALSVSNKGLSQAQNELYLRRQPEQLLGQELHLVE
jgi:uncharacterized repeat protein (TIGR01451 family)